MIKRIILSISLLVGLSAPALAQGFAIPCLYIAGGGCTPVTSGAPLPVTASVSVAGFTPGAAYATPLSVTNSSGNVALPAGTTVVVYNVGANAAYVKLGTSNAVTATTSDDYIGPGNALGFTVGSNTYLAAITASNTTTLNLSGGSGLFTGVGGGTSSGGGGGTSSNYGSAFPTAGTALGLTDGTDMRALWSFNFTSTEYAAAVEQVIGTGVISATNGSYFNILQGNAVNASGNPIFVQNTAGSAIIGNVRIDQTTAGTTNGVVDSTTETNTGTTATNTGTIAGAVTSSVMQSNTKQVNGVTTLAGAGATGTGSQRETVAQDTTTIAGSAPGTAGTASANVVTVQGIASGTVVPISAASLPLPTLAATSTLQSTINTTLGSPFQASGSIGNTSFAATQATAANLNATVVQGTAANLKMTEANSASILTAVTAAVPAGTNLIGKVGIDQTTAGTTNAVYLTGLDATALGAPSNYGTSPGAVEVQGVNAFVTNIPVVTPSSQYPSGAVAITASATGTTGATTATLAGTSGKTTYICSYSIRANATAATTVTDTITGTITGTLSSILWVAPLASGLGVDEEIFTPCVPASATNTGIAVVSGAPGSGGTVSSHATGYQL